jgi:DNA polymerase-3 subunit gamma/tau
MYGNHDVVHALEGMLQERETCPHSFLLHGPTGTGKTTVGRIITSELGCNGSDFKEVDSADFRGIDTVREIRRQSGYKPIEGPCRVWLIDECHKMTNDAQNALLKILEDTPNHIYFILCTTEPHKLLKTIRGRCTEFAMEPIDDKEMMKLLRYVVREEGESLQKIVYDQIIKRSFGLPRGALQLTDIILRLPDDQRVDAVKKAADVEFESIELCRALINTSGWRKVKEILSGLKDQDPEGVRRHVMGYASAVLVKQENDIAAKILEEFWEPFYNTGFPGLVYACYSVIKG